VILTVLLVGQAAAEEQWFAPFQRVADYRPKGPTHCFRQFNLDWSWVARRPEQIPEFLSQADPVALAEFCREMHVDGTVVMAVPHHGYCTYPSRVGTSFPGMKGDWFGRSIEELHKRRIAAFGYVTLNWNWKFMRENVGRDFIHGRPAADGVFPTSALICLNAPGYMELVEAHTREVLERYPVDGMRWDILFSAKHCTCAGCRRFYQDLYGQPLSGWETIDHRREMDFYLATMRRVVDRLHRLCKSIKPSVEIWQNCIQSYHDNDLNSGRQLDIAYNEYGDPFRLLFLKGVLAKDAAIDGLMNKAPAGAPLERAAFRLCLALGGRCYSYHGHLHTDHRRILPDDAIMAWHRQQLAPFYATAAQIEPWLIGARPVAPVAVVYCENTRYRFQGYKRAAYVDPLEKLTVASLQRSQPLDYVNSLDLAAATEPGRYRLLLLPQTSGLSPVELDLLRRYVRQGGTLLVAGDALRHDASGHEQPQFALAHEMGVDFDREAPAGGIGGIAGKLPGDGSPPTAEIQRFIRVRPTAGQTWLSIEQGGTHYPLLHVNGVPRGRTAYLASWDTASLTLAAIEALAGPPPVRVEPETCQVVLTAQSRQQRWVLHLLSDGDYRIEINRADAPVTKVTNQFPLAGWTYHTQVTPNRLRIEIHGPAQDRLLVLEP
jgi:hypothetical protein